MAEFGEDFDLDEFQRAYDSDDPVLLNRVKAVERGVDQLCNYIAELVAFGLERPGSVCRRPGRLPCTSARKVGRLACAPGGDLAQRTFGSRAFRG